MKDTNANWARKQIAMHGIDRYPNVATQFLKLVEEVGELSKAINRDKIDEIKGEAADTALALYNLADKLHFDLDEEIRNKVQNDTRKFA